MASSNVTLASTTTYRILQVSAGTWSVVQDNSYEKVFAPLTEAQSIILKHFKLAVLARENIDVEETE